MTDHDEHSDVPLRPDHVSDGAPEHDEGDSDAALAPTDGDGADGSADEEEAITSPAKVMRIGSMVKQLLEEVRSAPLDLASRERLAEIYERSVTELAEALSPGQQATLSFIVRPTRGGQDPRQITLTGAVLVGVEIHYEQNNTAAATLQFAAEASAGDVDPLSAEDLT